MQKFVEVKGKRIYEDYDVLIGRQTVFKAASEHADFRTRSGPGIRGKSRHMLEGMAPLIVNGAVLRGADILRMRRCHKVWLRVVGKATVTHKACEKVHEFRTGANQ